MKKLFLLSICAGLGMSAFAQSSSINSQAHAGVKPSTAAGRAHRATFVNDTEVMTNGIDPTIDTVYYVPVGTTLDSGYFVGEGLVGGTEFAQRYDFTSADSSVQVLGTITFLTGAVSPSSSNTMTFSAWSVAASSAATSTATYSGLPGTVLASGTAAFTSLGLPSATVYDTADFYTINYFSTPTSYLSTSFFVGCSMNYTWGSTNGDTVGINVTDFLPEAQYAISSGDTTINDQSAMNISGTWYDLGYDLGLPGDYFIFAIVNSNVTTSVKGITNKNLTFFGNYPNPACDQTNIKFSLATGTDVTITIMDMAGHTINTMVENNLQAGMNIIPVNTSAMASGDYLYLVRTADNSGIAGKMTIIK